jgi:hypothetical protein
MGVEEFHYQVPWRSRGSQPGHHRGTSAGGGFEFRGHASLLDAPDPRRVDVRASLRHPFEEIVMRVYTQRSAIPVYLIADLSASMGFEGYSRKLDVLSDFSASLGYSAYRTGDPFAFIGCDSVVRTDFFQPLTRTRTAGHRVSARLRDFVPDASNSRGMLEAPALIGKSRSLIFLCSDFHFSLQLTGQILTALAYHTVVPIVLWDTMELTVPATGIAAFREAETGRRRTVWLRSSYRQRIHRAFAERRQNLVDYFLAFGLTPLFILDRFDAGDVTRYFYERAG